GPVSPSPVPGRVHQLIGAMHDVPVIAANRLRDPVASNVLGRALFPHLFPTGGRPLNMSEYMFLDVRARTVYPDWETVARGAVSNLRLTAGAHPDDEDLMALIARLSSRSPQFRAWWGGHTVRVHTHGTKAI